MRAAGHVALMLLPSPMLAQGRSPQPASSTTSATVTATIVADRSIPCRSGQPFCTRDRPPTANASNPSTLAAYLATQSEAPPMAWTTTWTSTTRRRTNNDTLTVLLIY